MATISKKLSLTTKLFWSAFFVFIFVTVLSCKNQEGEGKGVWIPTPPDTSALGKRDHFIPIERMDEFKKQYAADRDSLLRCLPGYFMPSSEAFNKEWLLKVLKDPKCVGLRIFYGVRKMDKGNEFRLMIVGVDAQGNDLYIERGSALSNQVTGPGKGGLEWGQCDPPCVPQP
jgi:hypothetical protein